MKEPHSEAAATIRELKRQYDKRVKLPQALVEELTRASVLGQQAWVNARRDNDFLAFAPHAEKLFHLKRQQAECLGYEDNPYDALLDDFVRATCSALRPRFEASLSWPVACVFRGRWTDQRSVTGTTTQSGKPPTASQKKPSAKGLLTCLIQIVASSAIAPSERCIAPCAAGLRS